jgi:F-type H+-transporting ATPase subunit gamma
MKDINLRIKSIKSTKQITKAMELVATSKLTKAKERIEKTRLFHSTIYSAICDIAVSNRDTSSIFLAKREIKKSCLVVIAGDRGLAGGYNSNVFRFANEHFRQKEICILPIGKRSTEYYKRSDYEIVTDEFSHVEDLNVSSCHEIANLLVECYITNEFDEIFVVYTHFISILNQQPESMKLLPLIRNISENHDDPTKLKNDFILFEPSRDAVFNAIVPSYVTSMLWGAVCESLTSELGARRTAMESATKNAEDMIDNLSLQYNRARQGSITQEITEIVAGSGL